ncbi:uncharacterized protein [Arachis hypogaea]|uniref:uncharacterized protein n=1 Tax=Arachis hypogaea TaxID=3818 RepID=UPI003B21504A
MHYFIPFPVVQRVGKVAYKLELPSTANIHPVFHISLLKKCVGRPPSVTLPAPLTVDENGCKLLPLRVLGHQMIKVDNTWQEQVLIQWQHLSSEEATWKGYEDMRHLHPSFELEDKVNVHGGGVDTKREKRV